MIVMPPLSSLFIYVGIFFLVGLSHSMQLTPHQQSAEPRNSAGAEALAVARRPKETSRQKIRLPPVLRGSSPKNSSKGENSTHLSGTCSFLLCRGVRSRNAPTL